MNIVKKSAGSVGEHVWAEGGEAIDVPDELAGELLELAPHEFEVAEDKKPFRRGKRSGDPESDGE